MQEGALLEENFLQLHREFEASIQSNQDLTLLLARAQKKDVVRQKTIKKLTDVNNNLLKELEQYRSRGFHGGLSISTAHGSGTNLNVFDAWSSAPNVTPLSDSASQTIDMQRLADSVASQTTQTLAEEKSSRGVDGQIDGLPFLPSSSGKHGQGAFGATLGRVGIDNYSSDEAHEWIETMNLPDQTQQVLEELFGREGSLEDQGTVSGETSNRGPLQGQVENSLTNLHSSGGSQDVEVVHEPGGSSSPTGSNKGRSCDYEMLEHQRSSCSSYDSGTSVAAIPGAELGERPPAAVLASAVERLQEENRALRRQLKATSPSARNQTTPSSGSRRSPKQPVVLSPLKPQQGSGQKKDDASDAKATDLFGLAGTRLDLDVPTRGSAASAQQRSRSADYDYGKKRVSFESPKALVSYKSPEHPSGGQLGSASSSKALLAPSSRNLTFSPNEFGVSTATGQARIHENEVRVLKLELDSVTSTKEAIEEENRSLKIETKHLRKLLELKQGVGVGSSGQMSAAAESGEETSMVVESSSFNAGLQQPTRRGDSRSPLGKDAPVAAISKTTSPTQTKAAVKTSSASSSSSPHLNGVAAELESRTRELERQQLQSALLTAEARLKAKGIEHDRASETLRKEHGNTVETLRAEHAAVLKELRAELEALQTDSAARLQEARMEIEQECVEALEEAREEIWAEAQNEVLTFLQSQGAGTEVLEMVQLMRRATGAIKELERSVNNGSSLNTSLNYGAGGSTVSSSSKNVENASATSKTFLKEANPLSIVGATSSSKSTLNLMPDVQDVLPAIKAASHQSSSQRSTSRRSFPLDNEHAQPKNREEFPGSTNNKSSSSSRAPNAQAASSSWSPRQQDNIDFDFEMKASTRPEEHITLVFGGGPSEEDDDMRWQAMEQRLQKIQRDLVARTNSYVTQSNVFDESEAEARTPGGSSSGRKVAFEPPSRSFIDGGRPHASEEPDEGFGNEQEKLFLERLSQCERRGTAGQTNTTTAEQHQQEATSRSGWSSRGTSREAPNRGTLLDEHADSRLILSSGLQTKNVSKNSHFDQQHGFPTSSGEMSGSDIDVFLAGRSSSRSSVGAGIAVHSPPSSMHHTTGGLGGKQIPGIISPVQAALDGINGMTQQLDAASDGLHSHERHQQLRNTGQQLQQQEPLRQILSSEHLASSSAVPGGGAGTAFLQAPGSFDHVGMSKTPTLLLAAEQGHLQQFQQHPAAHHHLAGQPVITVPGAATSSDAFYQQQQQLHLQHTGMLISASQQPHHLEQLRHQAVAGGVQPQYSARSANRYAGARGSSSFGDQYHGYRTTSSSGATIGGSLKATAARLSGSPPKNRSKRRTSLRNSLSGGDGEPK
ncbi:unnamed protein product [Amoebophrya sp. A25]|nr:unnamed protein product [Amoebophrya sp. A25]|eukprot:GSA25T00014346001.1